MLSQLEASLQSAPCIALAADESTDISDDAQLLVYVRFYDVKRKDFCEDVSGVTALETHTRGEDIYQAIRDAGIERDQSEICGLHRYRWDSLQDRKRERSCGSYES